MAYDSGTGQLVLFGTDGTTWTWDGTTWTQLNPATSPPAQGGASMAYDSGTGQLVLFGGYNVITFGDTWTYGTPTVTAAPAITSGNSTTFIEGTLGTFTPTATGYPAPTFTEAGALPNGVTFSGGILSGTPTLSGTFPVTFTATNGVSPNATQSFTLTVNQAPAISSVNHATFTVGAAGSFTLTTNGGFPTPAWSETGSLPAGVHLTDNGDGTATLSGTPASGTAGTFPITVTASNGVLPNAVQSFTLTVLPFGISTKSLPPGKAGVAYAATLVATGGNPPYKWKVISGSLPKGFRLNKTTGIISGKTKQVGTLIFTVEVLDTKTKRTKGHPSTQNTATQVLSITIVPGP
jgi:hypothetical protein